MRSLKDDYYLKNGSLDLTMLDDKVQKANKNNENEKRNVYESKYISLKVDKIPDFRENRPIEAHITLEKLEDNIEESQLNEDIVKPYMSEEIHSVLKEMGTYLLDGGSEILATLDIESESVEGQRDYDLSLEYEKEVDYNLNSEYEEEVDYGLNSEYEDKLDYDLELDMGRSSTLDEDASQYAAAIPQDLAQDDRGVMTLNHSHEVLVDIECSKEIDRQSFRLRQYELLEGKVLTSNIISSSGEYIGRTGEVITKYMIGLAGEKKCMIKMIMHSE